MNEYEIAANYLLQATSYRPEIGSICGSGLSNLSKQLSDTVTINYESIPGFPEATVPGHSGELVFGTIGGIQCVCMRGRFHYYEGNSMNTVVLPVRAMRLLGVKLLIVTNAAGGLNRDYKVGDIMVIRDHFGVPCIAGNSPLVGHNDDKLGPRFPSTSDAFDEKLQDIVMKVSKENNISPYIRTGGTYCFVSGPAYESKAECRFLRLVGGDSVGMSTVPEILAAKHCGMKILGLSFITNKVVFSEDDALPAASHAEVLQAVIDSGKRIELLVKMFVLDKDLKDYLMKLPSLPYTFSTTTTTTDQKHTIINYNNKEFNDSNIKTNNSSQVVPLTPLTLVATASVSAIIGASVATFILLNYHLHRK